jgi:uncharacterized protein YndB with AHSA1/START domain
VSGDGILIRADGRYAVRFERSLRQPAKRVWAALTQPELLAGWIGTVRPGFVEGGEFDLTFEKTVGSVVHGRVTRLDAPRVLEHTFDSDESIVRWEVDPIGESSVLMLTQTLLGPEEAPSTLAGWDTLIEGIPLVLDGKRFEWSPVRWEDVHNGYVANLS